MNGRTTHRTTQCSQLLSCGRGLVAKARKGDAPRVKINIRTDRLTKVDEKKETKGRRYYQGQLYLRSTICQSHLNHELQSQVHEDWRRQRRKSNVNPPPLNPPNAPKPEGKVVAVAEEAPERIVTPPNQPSSPVCASAVPVEGLFLRCCVIHISVRYVPRPTNRHVDFAEHFTRFDIKYGRSEGELFWGGDGGCSAAKLCRFPQWMVQEEDEDTLVLWGCLGLLGSQSE